MTIFNIRTRLYPELDAAAAAMQQVIQAITASTWRKTPVYSLLQELSSPLHRCLRELKRLLLFTRDNRYTQLTLTRIVQRLNVIINRIVRFADHHPFLKDVQATLIGFYRNFLQLLPKEITSIQLELFPVEEIPLDTNKLTLAPVLSWLKHWSMIIQDVPYTTNYGMRAYRRVTRYAAHVERQRQRFPALVVQQLSLAITKD